MTLHNESYNAMQSAETAGKFTVKTEAYLVVKRASAKTITRLD